MELWPLYSVPKELPSNRKYTLALFSRRNHNIRKLKSTVGILLNLLLLLLLLLFYFPLCKCSRSRDIKKYPDFVGDEEAMVANIY